MKNLKLIILFLCLLFVVACHHKRDKKKNTPYVSINYSYPTDSTTINKWISNNNFTAMYKHSWSIWQHITNPIENSKLEYQTWLSPYQIKQKMDNPTANNSKEPFFNTPSQFDHAATKQTTFDDTNVVEVVAYNKAAENFAINNKIFYLSTLKALQEEGGNYAQIPDFKNDAIIIKPTYKIITKAKLNNGIYTMAAWNGPEQHDDGYPESAWNSCIHIDISKNTDSNPNGRIDYTCDSITPKNTYSLNDFIHFKISNDQALAYNKKMKQDINEEIEEGNEHLERMKTQQGDIAILVGLHATTKETKRWVWQSFWWSPTPSTPNTPSSTEIATAKHGIELYGAANHYAMSIAYSMLIPAQPYIGGKNEGELVVGYNPYLESGFGNDVFSGSNSYVYNKGNKIETDLGVMTNCMSCHMASSIDTKTMSESVFFGNTYLSYKDSIFKNKLMLDFVWSIKSNIEPSK